MDTTELSGSPTNGVATSVPATPVAASVTPTPAAAPAAKPSLADQLASELHALANGTTPTPAVAVPEAAAPAATEAEDLRARDEQGRFVKADATPAAAPAAAKEPMYVDPDYGEIPLSQVPELLKARLEFERAQLSGPSQEAITKAQAAEATRLAAESRAQELQSTLEQMIHLGRNDLDGLVAFLNSPVLAPQAGPAQPVAARPTTPALTQEEIDRRIDARWAQREQEARLQQEQAQRFQTVQTKIDGILNTQFPKEVFGDAQEIALMAVGKQVDLATQRGEFPKALPEYLWTQKLTAICNRVKSQLNGLMVSRAQQQSAITASVPPPMVGGATPMPKVAPEPWKPFSRNDAATQLQNRLEALSRGIL